MKIVVKILTFEQNHNILFARQEIANSILLKIKKAKFQIIQDKVKF
jgi:hypothetical protein